MTYSHRMTWDKSELTAEESGGTGAGPLLLASSLSLFHSLAG